MGVSLPKQPFFTISIISGVLGLTLLITSSVFLSFYPKGLDICVGDLCDYVSWGIAAGAFGIIASLIQLVTVALGWINKWKIWSIVHVAIFILTLTSYAILADKPIYGVFTEGNLKTIQSLRAFLAIDMTFSFFFAGMVFYLDRNE